jgi:hypothetical protein
MDNMNQQQQRNTTAGAGQEDYVDKGKGLQSCGTLAWSMSI